MFSSFDKSRRTVCGAGSSSILSVSLCVVLKDFRADLFSPLSLREKLGIYVNPDVSVFRDQRVLRGRDIPECTSFFEEFKRNCATSERRGLACHLDAMFNVGKTSPPSLGVVMRFETSASSWRKRWRLLSSMWPTKDSMRRLRISFRLPALKNVQCSISGLNSGIANISHCRLDLSAWADLHNLTFATPPEADIDSQGEVAHLSDIFAMVVNRFCGDMTFQSHQEAVSTLAEALLHVLHFRTTILRANDLILQVVFKESDDDAAIVLKAHANWKLADKSLTDDQHDSREVEVVVENADQEKDEAEQDEQHATDNETTDDQGSTAATAPQSSSVAPEPTAANESISSLLKEWPRSGKLVLEKYVGGR